MSADDADHRTMRRPLTPTQILVKALGDGMLKYRLVGSRMPYLDLHPKNVNAANIERRLQRSDFGEVVLRNGESLSAEHTNARFPELGLFAGTDQLIDVSLRAIGCDEKDGSWSREIAIQLWYGNVDAAACQEVSITVQTAAQRLCISRTVVAPTYGDDIEYEFHNQKYLWADDNQALEFMSIANELFAASPKPRLTTELN